MSLFMKKGNQFKVTTKDALDVHERLPAGTYTVGFNEMCGEYFLERIDDLEVKHKLYGKTARHSGHILKTFFSRSKQTGVLLSGQKGSGKSLLAKKLSSECAARGIPTIVINHPWHGDKFNEFIQMIEQPKMVLLDEFEKVYNSHEQEKMLTLLDGVYPSNTLFVLTCNDQWRVDKNMINRPGRIYYLLKFKGLEEAFIREYCADNLNEHEKHVEKVCAIARLFVGDFNFDMLKALVEELNRFPDEAPEDLLEILNVKPDMTEECAFRIKFFDRRGKEVKHHNLYSGNTWHGNPMAKGVTVDYNKENTEGGYEMGSASFAATDIKYLDGNSGKFVLINSKNEKVILVKKEKHGTGWKFNGPSLPTSDPAHDGTDYTDDDEDDNSGGTCPESSDGSDEDKNMEV